MKKTCEQSRRDGFKLSLIILLLCTCHVAYAQKKKSSDDTREWQSVYLQYNPMTLVYSNDVEDKSYNGFTIGCNKAFSIAQSIPLFVEVGGALQAIFYTNDDNDNWDYKYSLVSLKAPGNLVYKWRVSDKVTLLPYVGLVMKLHIIGNRTSEYTGRSTDYPDEDGKTRCLFDKKDMGSKDLTWNRFQIGFQIGANVMFDKKWYLGLSYGKDFGEVVKKATFSTVSITAGYVF